MGNFGMAVKIVGGYTVKPSKRTFPAYEHLIVKLAYKLICQPFFLHHALIIFIKALGISDYTQL